MLSALLIFTLVIVLAGCARSPAGLITNNAPPQTIYSEITVAGNINPTYYYFFAIDTSGNQGEGPIPVTLGTGYGNGWGTLYPVNANGPVQQPSFFVRIYNGTAEEYRVDPTTQIANPIGSPYRWQVMAADHTPSQTGPILSVEIDTRQLMPPGTALPAGINVNWITMQTIATSPQNVGVSNIYDGFTGASGTSGNGFFWVPLGISNAWTSGYNGVPSQNSQTSPAATLTDINLVNWLIVDRLN